MSDERSPAVALRARVLNDEGEQPIQLVLSAAVAADLAFITEDFALQVDPNSDEVVRLVHVAEVAATRLKDCLAARGGDGST